MRKLLLAVLIFPFIIIPSNAQDENKMPEFNIKQYFFVMLVKGENANKIDSLQLNQLMIGHLNNIKKMAREGKLLIAGPFGDDGYWRGIFIFDAKSKEEVVELLKNDPAIQAGRLAYEIHPWWAEPGSCLK
jgi:uncharacterized protein YciI